MYPFFIGSVPTESEKKLANTYFYDKEMCTLAWKLFLPEEELSLDHPAGNPLIPDRSPPLKLMPPTLTIVAEHDWMRDRAIAYSEALRNVNVVAPVLEYKDAVHEFANLDILLKTPQAQACAEDIVIWVRSTSHIEIMSSRINSEVSSEGEKNCGSVIQLRKKTMHDCLTVGWSVTRLG
ncbi:hypothetical protein J1N35_038620 [Gossypium stocksii]|uniref:Alpha/beta hydrolase fold-3 domain-containing protein n=1 Tax=Gossypium stocksii TaxID=47602 RepID=A0A9D3ZM03_9ROSI|nr:hypothetical protein J1N35_038620 [Gossypium stocksii]